MEGFLLALEAGRWGGGVRDNGFFLTGLVSVLRQNPRGGRGYVRVSELSSMGSFVAGLK